MCRLLIKALYGLRQAPRAWFDRLMKWGFVNTFGDNSLFVLKTEAHVLMILIYVDDILVTGNNDEILQIFVVRLNQIFALKDLGDVHYFLGIEVFRDETGFFLTQKR